MDTVIVALIVGFLLSAFMRYDMKLFKATRRNATLLAIGFFIALVGVASIDGCSFLLGIVNAASSCPTILIARENISTHVLGVEPVNQVSAIVGTVGFVLATSGTRSKKWLGLGMILGLFFLYMIWRTVVPST